VFVKIYPVIAPKQENNVFSRFIPLQKAIPSGEKCSYVEADATVPATRKHKVCVITDFPNSDTFILLPSTLDPNSRFFISSPLSL
jgi:hypothetical protein